MNALEAEVLEKFLQLDELSQQRVIQQAEQIRQQRALQWQVWQKKTAEIATTLQKKYPDGVGMNLDALLDEVREGRDE